MQFFTRLSELSRMKIPSQSLSVKNCRMQRNLYMNSRLPVMQMSNRSAQAAVARGDAERKLQRRQATPDVISRRHV